MLVKVRGHSSSVNGCRLTSWRSPAAAQHPACSRRVQRLGASLPFVVIPWYDHGMKVALSIPDDLFESADALAQRLGLSRSRLYATALAEFVAKHRGRKVTERLDAVYAAEDSRLDAGTRRMQNRSLQHEPW